MSKRFGRNSKRKLRTKIWELQGGNIATKLAARNIEQSLIIDLAQAKRDLYLAEQEIEILTNYNFPHKPVVDTFREELHRSTVVHIEIPPYPLEISDNIMVSGTGIKRNFYLEDLLEKQCLAAKNVIRKAITEAVENARQI